ncbi:MAG: marine proteobacterial sortase target protein [Deltaproteobacteria bacterium]|nr:marine proteobacterial sortase target protein [Deltaproteobacteria bacterium]
MKFAAAASLALPLLLLSLPALAQTRPIKSTGEVEAGALLLKSDDGYNAAFAVHTEAHLQITGMISRTQVVQRFTNPTGHYVEGLYVFPLSEGAAVDRMKLRIGERTIEGQIKEKAEAQAIYEQAKAEGKKASLLTQDRPNLFSTQVANLGPGETLVVELEYQEPVRYDSGRFQLRFPLAITPRYEPVTSGFLNVTPSPKLPVGNLKAQSATIDVSLEAGFAVAQIESLHHPIVQRQEADRISVNLSSGPVPTDRDFVLEWAPKPSQEPQAAFFHEATGGESYGYLMLLPPNDVKKQRRVSKEAIFIIDTSGSMEGPSMVQAKHALAMAIQRLDPEDTFEVIEFDDQARALFGEVRSANDENRSAAIGWVQALSANGGTNMRAALELALDGRKETPRLRQVVFITDGAVGNEMELFRFISDRLGASRLYTVGIGSAPNSWFMREAAQFGRGTSTFIGDPNQVEAKMGELFQKIESPAVTDLILDFDALSAEVFPDRLPDLYLGEPLTVAVRLSQSPKSVTLRELRGQETFRVELGLEQSGAKLRGIGKVWARSKIEALTDKIATGTPELEVKPEILRVALQHGLVSAYTSLVAVDTTPSRPASEPLATPNTPEPAYAQAMPQGATPAGLLAWVGATCLALAGGLFRRRRA